MSTIEVDPGIKALLDAMAAMGGPPLSELGAPAAREAFRAMDLSGEKAAVASVEDRTIPGAGGDLPVRVYRPADGDLGALVFFHGGGWVIGDLDTHDGPCRALASGAGCVVVSVDYRLAPEHPCPAAADDAWTALRWVVDHAGELGVDPERIAVGGDSAGGHLAASTALRARDEGLALRHQLLVYPVTDLGATGGSREANGEGYFLTQETMVWFEGCYLAGRDGASVSPLHHDPAGTAPAHVLTAGFDPLRDEGQAYAEKLAASLLAFGLVRVIDATSVLSDPYGEGWDLLGTIAWRGPANWESSRRLAWTELAILLLGTIGAVVAAHDATLRSEPGRASAERALLPQLATGSVLAVAVLLVLLG